MVIKQWFNVPVNIQCTIHLVWASEFPPKPSELLTTTTRPAYSTSSASYINTELQATTTKISNVESNQTQIITDPVKQKQQDPSMIN